MADREAIADLLRRTRKAQNLGERLAPEVVTEVSKVVGADARRQRQSKRKAA
jgi:hypothetical protein